MTQFSDLPNNKLAENYDDFLFYQVYPAMAEINRTNTTTDYRNEQLTKRLLDNFREDGPWDLSSERRPEFPNKNTYQPFKQLLVTGPFLNGFTAGMATAAAGQYPDIAPKAPYREHPYPTQNYEKVGVSPIAALAGFNHYYGNDEWQQWDYPTELAYNPNSAPKMQPKVQESYNFQPIINAAKNELNKLINTAQNELKKKRGELKNELIKVRYPEHPTGVNTNKKRIKLDFVHYIDLASKLGANYLFGNGQPVEIDFSKVNFSEELDVPRLFLTLSSEKNIKRFENFISELKTGYHQKDKNRLLAQLDTILKDAFPNKQVEIGSLKQEYLVLNFKKPYKGVALNLFKTQDDNSKGAQNYINPKVISFGRLAVDVENMRLMIDLKKQTVEVTAQLNPSYRSGLIPYDPDLVDIFDFNPDPKRDSGGDKITTIVHNNVGGTVFKIYRIRGTQSEFSKTYEVNNLSKSQFITKH